MGCFIWIFTYASIIKFINIVIRHVYTHVSTLQNKVLSDLKTRLIWVPYIIANLMLLNGHFTFMHYPAFLDSTFKLHFSCNTHKYLSDLTFSTVCKSQRLRVWKECFPLAEMSRYTVPKDSTHGFTRNVTMM